MVPRVGFEPTTSGLEVLCSIQLSYRGTAKQIITGKYAKGQLQLHPQLIEEQAL